MSLLESGDKLGAVRYIQQALSLNAEDALTLAEKLEEQDEGPSPAPNIEGINPGRVVGIIFTIAGFLLLSLAFIFGFRDYRFATTAIPVTGKVVRIEKRQSSGETQMYAPVVTYVFAGTTREYLTDISSSSPGFAVGDNVELLVNPGDPTEVRLNSFLDRWFVVTLLGGLGLVFSVIGYFARKVMSPR